MYYCISRWIRKFDYQKTVSVLVTTLLIFQIIGVVFLFIPLLKQVKASGSIEQTATGTQADDNDSSVTMAFDCNGGDLLVVGVTAVSSGSNVAPVTYKGVTMTDSGQGIVDSTQDSVVLLFYLVNPASGSNTISINNLSGRSVTPIASAWSGVDTADPFDISASDKNAGSANPSVNITTSAADKLIIDVMMDGYQSIPSANSHTLISSQENGYRTSNAQYTLNDGSSGITLDWTVTSDNWAMIVAAFNPADTPQNNGSPPNNDSTQDPNILPQTGADIRKQK